jgi:hypothetical protein
LRTSSGRQKNKIVVLRDNDKTFLPTIMPNRTIVVSGEADKVSVAAGESHIRRIGVVSVYARLKAIKFFSVSSEIRFAPDPLGLFQMLSADDELLAAEQPRGEPE